MIKVAGSCLILFSSTAIGFWCSGRLRDRLEELEYIRKLLLMLRGEIRYSHATLSEAFQAIGKRMKPPYGAFLLRTAEAMDSMEGQTLSQLWETGIREELTDSALKKEDKERLIWLGSQLGYLDTQMQLSTIELYLEQIQEELQSAAESVKRNGRLYQTLGVMAGIFLVILMI